MELRYDLCREDCEAIIMLKEARKKFYTVAEKYKNEKHKELDTYREEVRERERGLEYVMYSSFADLLNNIFHAIHRLEIRKGFLQAFPHGHSSFHLT